MSEQKVWHPLRRPDLGLPNLISDIISQAEWRNPDLLTSVRLGKTLILTSDYSGDNKDSHYESISFLIADFAFCWFWNDLRQKIRKEILRDSRSISFKKLNDERRAKSLIPFLRAANTIPGLLITFLVDKKIILGQTKEESDDISRTSVIGLSNWNKKSFSKLTRISQLGAMLVACMSAPGQDVFWITDEDEIAPNSGKLAEATQLIGHIMNHYCFHDMGHFRFGTTKADDGSMEIEDLTALPDLAAGALSEIMTAAYNNQALPPNQVYLPLPSGISQKAQTIIAWISDRPHPLRKLSIYVDSTGEGRNRVRLLDTLLEAPISEYDWRPELLEYTKDNLIFRR